jgi:HK97 family phage major capsid protein
MDKRSLIAELSAKRSAERAKLDTLLGEARAADAMTDEQRAAFDAGETEIRELDERIAELDKQVRADEAAAEVAKRYAAPRVESVKEPEIYRSGVGGQSYFRDMWNARQNGDTAAMDRLKRNNAARAEERSSVGITTVNGAGGEFVPPLWLEQQFIRLARPARITGNLVPTQPLPAGTDSINIPKVATGTTVAQQATQNQAISQTDLTTTSVNSPVITLAGAQVLSLQLIEQSPLNVDDIVLADLAAAYAQAYNSQILSGAGGAGNLTGIMTLAGTNAIDFSAAITGTWAGAFYSKLNDGIQRIHTNRFLPPDTIIMHPVRWAYLLTQVDSQGRPLVVPDAGAPMNALGNQDGVVSQGYVGRMLGLPVYVDAMIPTNLTAGAGTNEDAVIVARMADLMAWEGNFKAEAFPQTYANQLSVLVRLYNYASFQPARYPKSISVITGKNLGAPSF